jgi:prevent-host-death family protein
MRIRIGRLRHSQYSIQDSQYSYIGYNRALPTTGPTMKTLASRVVQNNFGGIADIVKSGEPVTVTQHGRPTLMILPYAQGQEALRLLAAQRMGAFLDGLPGEFVDPTAPALSPKEINSLVHELRP